MPTSVMLEHNQLGVETVYKPVAGEILPTDAIANASNGYAIAMFKAQSLVPVISTYNGTATEPDYSEDPDDDKGTSGECVITKVYYEGEYDRTSGTTTMTRVGTFVTEETTGNILIEDEKSKTGYTLNCYGAFTNQKKRQLRLDDVRRTQSNYAGFKAAVQQGSPKGRQGGLINIGDPMIGTQNTKYLYVIYTKTTVPPPEEVSDYDFVIPESYITKQIYFSDGLNTAEDEDEATARGLIAHDFRWVSEAHGTCSGHTALVCGIPYHNCADSTSSAGGNTLTCGFNYEHTHGTDEVNCKYRKYKCDTCGAESGWSLATNTPVNLNSNGKLIHNKLSNGQNCTATETYTDVYKGDVAEYKCSVCGNTATTAAGVSHKDTCASNSIYSVAPSKCGITQHTHAGWSSTTNPGCYNTITVYNCTGTTNECNDKHIHKVPTATNSCYADKTCTVSWVQRKPKLALKASFDLQTASGQANYNDNYKDIVTKSSKVFNDPGENEATISGLSSKVYTEHTRPEPSSNADETGDINGFDYSVILVRGKDKITIADWKYTRRTVPDRLQDLRYDGHKFRIGNLPLTYDNEDNLIRHPGLATNSDSGNKYYIDNFAIKFVDKNGNGTTTEAKKDDTAIKFTKAKDKKGNACQYEWSTTNGQIDYQTHSQNRKEYALATDANHSIFEVEEVNVAVEVFDDYSRTNGTPEDTRRTQTTTVNFLPYVKMHYDYAGNNEVGNNTVYVLGEEYRTFSAHNGASVSLGGNNGVLGLTSSQWSTHAGIKEMLKDKYDNISNNELKKKSKKVLPGGATLDISTNNTRCRTVTVKTYQLLLEEGSAGYKQVDSTNGLDSSTVETEIAPLQSAHNTFANSVASSIENNLAIMQYVRKPSEPWYRVKPGEKVLGRETSSEDKYYFKGYNRSKLGTDVGTASEKKYTVKATANGCIKVNNTIVLTKGQSPSTMTNTIAKKIDAETGVITALYNSLLTNAGNDTTLEDPKWYNEAFDGIVVCEFTTTIKIGLFEVNPISTVTDPKLIPEQSTSEGSIFTDLYESRYVSATLNGSDSLSFNFQGDTATLDVSNIYQSPVFYIPNVTVQDLN